MKKKTATAKPARIRGMSLVVCKAQGVDLGVLQNDLAEAKKVAKGANQRLANAEQADTEAKEALRRATDRLASASKTILAG